MDCCSDVSGKITGMINSANLLKKKLCTFSFEPFWFNHFYGVNIFFAFYNKKKDSQNKINKI